MKKTQLIIFTLTIFCLMACQKNVVKTPSPVATPTTPQDGATATTIESPDQYISQVISKNPALWKTFAQAEQYFHAHQYDTAIKYYTLARQQAPRSQVDMVSTFRLGHSYFLKRLFPFAKGEFISLLNRFPNSLLSFDAKYNLAAAEYQLKDYTKSYEHLVSLDKRSLNAKGISKQALYARLRALSAYRIQNYYDASQHFSLMFEYPLTPGQREEAIRYLSQSLEKMNDIAQLNTLLDNRPNIAAQDKIRSRIKWLSQNEEDILAYSDPTQVTHRRVEKFKNWQNYEQRNISRIGVLLPTTGRWARIGKQAIQAINIGINRLRQTHPQIQIFFEDSGSDPYMAKQAVNRLILEKKTPIIIGPIDKTVALEVAKNCQKLGVLNLSLSQNPDLALKGNYIFQNMILPKYQIRSIVHHSMKRLGLKRFAVLAPNDRFGQSMARAFMSEVRNQGGVISALETYDTQTSDFQTHIKALTGRENRKWRKSEQRALRQYLHKENEGRRRKLKLSLPPIVDFDAVFIPDSPQKAIQIAPNFSYLDVEGIRLIGTTEWNPSYLMSRGARYFKGAFFPGAVSADHPNPKHRQFISLYQSLTDPPKVPSLMSALAYEALEIGTQLLIRFPHQNTHQVIETSLNQMKFNTIFGNVQIDKSGYINRNVPIFEIRSQDKLDIFG